MAQALGLPITVEPLVWERCVFSCDLGTPPSQLVGLWPELDFAHLEEGWWGARPRPRPALTAAAPRSSKTDHLPTAARWRSSPIGGSSAHSPARELSTAVRLGWPEPAPSPPSFPFPHSFPTPSSHLRTTIHGRDPTEAGRRPRADRYPPRLMIVSQYVGTCRSRTRAPASLNPNQGRPEIQIRVDVRAQHSAANATRCCCTCRSRPRRATRPGSCWSCSAGVRSGHVPPDSLQPLLLIECPRLLFPFARRGSPTPPATAAFPPWLDPTDFVTLSPASAAGPGKAQAGCPTLLGDGATS